MARNIPKAAKRIARIAAMERKVRKILSPEEAFLDDLIRNQAVYLADGERAIRNSRRILQEMQQDLEEEYRRKFSEGITPRMRKRMEAAIDNVRQTQRQATRNYRTQIQRVTNDLTRAKTLADGEAIAEFAPGFDAGLSAQQVRAISRKEFIGDTASRWFDTTAVLESDKVARSLRMSFALGESFPDIITRLRGHTATRDRALESLARTVIQGVANEAAHESYDRNRDVLSGKQWIATLDDRTCPQCGPLDGRIWKYKGRPNVSSMPRAPLHPNCVTAETLVASGSGISADSKRWYEGDLVVIRTALDKQLACTPNHPILTDNGWVPAGELHKGIRVLSAAGIKGPGGTPDDQNVPTRIHEIADSLGISDSMAARKVPVAPPDFHGDGMGSDIAVVRADRLLWGALDAEPIQQLEKLPFELGARPGDPLSELGGLAEFLMGALATPCCGICFSSLTGPLLWGLTRPLEGLGLRLGAALNTGLQQKPLAQSARYAQPNRDAVLRLAGQVQADKVVSVNVRSFSGHVYNLQTGDGIYSANGIVTHNCRCFVAPLVRGLSNPEIPTWAEWLKRQDRTETDPKTGKEFNVMERIVGSTRARLLRDPDIPITADDLRIRTGGIRPVGDLVKLAEGRAA